MSLDQTILISRKIWVTEKAVIFTVIGKIWFLKSLRLLKFWFVISTMDLALETQTLIYQVETSFSWSFLVFFHSQSFQSMLFLENFFQFGVISCWFVKYFGWNFSNIIIHSKLKDWHNVEISENQFRGFIEVQNLLFSHF